MQTLRDAPYSLAYGDLVEVRVRAYNALGEGYYSQVNTAGATIETEPGQMTAPTRGSSTDTSQIEVSWSASTDTGGSAITSYHLEEETAVGSGVWISVQGESGSESLLTTYTKTGLSQGDEYSYRVTAVNQYGDGTASSSVTLVASSQPEAPSAPTISLSNTFARITFVAPDDNGESIDAYRVKVR